MSTGWVAILAAAAAFAGAAVGHVVTYMVARRQNLQHRQQDALTNLRWAAEQALSEDPVRARLGVRFIAALARSDIDEDTEAMVDATLAAVVEPVADEYDDAVDDDRYVETFIEIDET